MAQFLAPIINDQQEDSNGAPLSGGTIEVYLAGTSTPSTTYSDKAGLVPNTWPIVLNTLGVNNQGAVWLTGGVAYKYVIKNALGVVQRTIDNVSGINDTAVTADQWVVFQGAPTFVSATTFTVPGDQTQTFAFGTRVRTVNTGGVVYGTVVRSVFGSSTTVTIIPDSGALDSGLSLVSVGLITPVNPSLPSTLTTPPFRNRIINAALRRDQRNEGLSQAITAGAAVYTADRYYVSCTGANITSQRVAGTGYQFAQTLTGAASVSATRWGQRIEGNNCADWANKQVNVQIPISAVGIASVTWNAYVANATDNFAATTLLATGTLALTGVVETKFFSFAAGANAGRGIAIEFATGALTAGQSITFQGAFQAEADQVSPFEVVDVGEDLRRCQRYYSKSYRQGVRPGTNTGVADGGEDGPGTGVNFVALIGRVVFPTSMRTASPTVFLYDALGALGITVFAPGQNNGQSASSDNFSERGFKIFTSTANPQRYFFHWTAAAEL